MSAATVSSMGGGVANAWLWREPERRRLVRLCAVLSGSREAAEDLAQETLLEAWRNAHKLHDPAGADRWLTAIARNVCLRWLRRNGASSAALVPLEADPGLADSFDMDVELERAELAELLDRGLALLPAETREVLVARYVHSARHAELAERLGMSEDAVSMRLSRGKVALRRVLAAELADEAAAYGIGDEDAGWRETRIWCSDCGRRKLHARRSPDAVSFRCPGCNPGGVGSEFSLANPFFARLLGDLVRPSAILARAADWSRRYFGGGASDNVACTRCAEPVVLQRYHHDRTGRPSDGLYAECPKCGEQVSSSVRGLAVTHPDVRRFGREHPRSTLVPLGEADVGGIPSLVVRAEDAGRSRRIDVVFARDTLRVVRVATG